MNYNLIVKKLLELETLNKLKVIAINSNECKVEVEVGEKRYMIIVEKRCVGGKDIDAIRIEGNVLFDLEQLEEYLEKEEKKEKLTYEEKIKSKIIEILDTKMPNKEIENKYTKYSGVINNNHYEVYVVNSKDIDISFIYKDEEEKLFREANSNILQYNKYIDGQIVYNFKILLSRYYEKENDFNKTYDDVSKKLFLEALKVVTSNSYIGYLMFLVGEAIIEEPNKKKGETLRDVLNKN